MLEFTFYALIQQTISPTMFHTATVRPTRSDPDILYNTPLNGDTDECGATNSEIDCKNNPGIEMCHSIFDDLRTKLKFSKIRRQPGQLHYPWRQL